MQLLGNPWNRGDIKQVLHNVLLLLIKNCMMCLTSLYLSLIRPNKTLFALKCLFYFLLQYCGQRDSFFCSFRRSLILEELKMFWEKYCREQICVFWQWHHNNVVLHWTFLLHQTFFNLSFMIILFNIFLKVSGD